MKDLIVGLTTKAIEAVPWKLVSRVISQPKVGKILAVILLAATSVLTWAYIKAADQGQISLETVATVRTEPTPQAFKGIEALVTETSKSYTESFKNSKPSDALRDAFRSIKNAIDRWDRPKLRTENTQAARESEEQHPANEDTEPSNKRAKWPRLRITDSHREYTRRRGVVLTESSHSAGGRKMGFLFIPTTILGHPFDSDVINSLATSSRSTRQLTQEEVEALIAPDSTLEQDIFFTEEIGRPVATLLDAQVSDSSRKRPAQVYIITERGVNRIFDRRGSVYEKQFHPEIFFPSRPYFWEAMHRSARNLDSLDLPSVIGDRFYVSLPYIDIGGHGFVITIAVGLEIPGKPRCAICMDIPLDDDNAPPTRVIERLKALGCDYAHCRAEIPVRGRDDPRVEVVTGNKSLESKLRQHIKASASLSDVFGQISVTAPGKHIRSDESGSAREPYTVFLPLKREVHDGDNVGHFLVIDLDVNAWRQPATWFGIAAGFSFAGLCGLLIAIWTRRQTELQTWQDSVRSVGGILQHSKTPFVELNERGVISVQNAAFTRAFGEKNEQLRPLIAKDYHRLYDQVNAYRRNHAASAQIIYRIEIDGAKKTANPCRYIVSASAPGNRRDEVPRTFGMLLTETDLKHDPEIGETQIKHLQNGNLIIDGDLVDRASLPSI